jgi:hypothetical protein
MQKTSLRSNTSACAPKTVSPCRGMKSSRGTSTPKESTSYSPTKTSSALRSKDHVRSISSTSSNRTRSIPASSRRRTTSFRRRAASDRMHYCARRCAVPARWASGRSSSDRSRTWLP